MICKIFINRLRPRQIYKGYKRRDFEDLVDRSKKVEQDLDYKVAVEEVRRESALAYAKAVKRQEKAIRV